MVAGGRLRVPAWKEYLKAESDRARAIYQDLLPVLAYLDAELVKDAIEIKSAEFHKTIDLLSQYELADGDFT